MHAAFNWNKAFCPQAKWTLKIDNDMVANLQRLDFWIEEKFKKELITNKATIFGRPFIYSPRVTDETNYKYYVSPDDYAGEYYPPYMSGPSYLLTREAISLILHYASQVKAIHLEDALFTGIIARKANISHCGHWSKFNTFENMYDNLGCEECVPLLITTVAYQGVSKTYEGLNNIACL
uniref:Hexosyltransferase n=1 Tax=Meloidogyne enterolobii TaxID=390850 RepID=A0A6V7U8U9_MELEN|nr:unnamed protein product [Meloidogyne enterolobii]